MLRPARSMRLRRPVPMIERYPIAQRTPSKQGQFFHLGSDTWQAFALEPAILALR